MRSINMKLSHLARLIGVTTLTLTLGIAGASHARAQTASAAKTATTDDAALKSLLQKRLMIPDAKDITLGPVTPGPFPGVLNRTVTVANSEGQKAEVELFTQSTGNKMMIAQRYAAFDRDHPWEQVDMKQIRTANRPQMGPASAPITIIEFGDFQCPYCAQAFSEIETLVNSTHKNQVRLIWKNFPLNVHPWAEQAAVAAECAHEQNPAAFWSFARDLYRDQNEISPETLRQHIDRYAKSLGLDDKVMSACMLGKAAEAQVQQDLADGRAIHVNSTPTFVIDGTPVIGLPSGSVFDFVISSKLQQDKTAAR